MPLDDTGFVYDHRPWREPQGRGQAVPPVPPERPLGAEPQPLSSLAHLALSASACLLSWGLALALIGIGVGVLTILGVL